MPAYKMHSRNFIMTRTPSDCRIPCLWSAALFTASRNGKISSRSTNSSTKSPSYSRYGSDENDRLTRNESFSLSLCVSGGRR